jgi:hypothetical protein
MEKDKVIGSATIDQLKAAELVYMTLIMGYMSDVDKLRSRFDNFEWFTEESIKILSLMGLRGNLKQMIMDKLSGKPLSIKDSYEAMKASSDIKIAAISICCLKLVFSEYPKSYYEFVNKTSMLLKNTGDFNVLNASSNIYLLLKIIDIDRSYLTVEMINDINKGKEYRLAMEHINKWIPTLKPYSGDADGYYNYIYSEAVEFYSKLNQLGFFSTVNLNLFVLNAILSTVSDDVVFDFYKHDARINEPKIATEDVKMAIRKMHSPVTEDENSDRWGE